MYISEGDGPAIFSPGEPFTTRLRNILSEYPDGLQIFREIIQNSDDAKATKQSFILDHNTHPSTGLLDDRLKCYQGPALLAGNDSTFKEKDFISLLNLADSEKKDDFSQIGSKGVGFNSVYHITDSPQFITDRHFVVLDPHKRFFQGGVKCDFVTDRMSTRYPDQLKPFQIDGIDLNMAHEGTLFRYPLRTREDAQISEISNKVYTPTDILAMFSSFYKDGFYCLMFLKHVEQINFYEWNVGQRVPTLLHSIVVDNANAIRSKRRFLGENVGEVLNADRKAISSDYLIKFRSDNFQTGETRYSRWCLVNEIGDMLQTERDYADGTRHKFVPWVGLAAPLDNLDETLAPGKLFCFLPLPINIPSSVCINGYFSVSMNRRTLHMMDDDIARSSDAHVGATWNADLFTNLIPRVWVRLLRTTKEHIDPRTLAANIYRLWPVGESAVDVRIPWTDVLKNFVTSLTRDDAVFPLDGENQLRWVSLANSFIPNRDLDDSSLRDIVRRIEMPVLMELPEPVEAALRTSELELSMVNPLSVRTSLRQNIIRWPALLSHEAKVLLLRYIMSDGEYGDLDGLPLVPLADKTFGMFHTSFRPDPYYIVTPELEELFPASHDQFIDKVTPDDILSTMKDNARTWVVNVRIPTNTVLAQLTREVLSAIPGFDPAADEIAWSGVPNTFPDMNWFASLWRYLYEMNVDLSDFADLHMLPTHHETLHKLNKKHGLLNQAGGDDAIVNVLRRFGCRFLTRRWNGERFITWENFKEYVDRVDNPWAVLSSLHAVASYPQNMSSVGLNESERKTLVTYFYQKVRSELPTPALREALAHVPMFTHPTDESRFLALQRSNSTSWHILLPR